MCPPFRGGGGGDCDSQCFAISRNFALFRNFSQVLAILHIFAFFFFGNFRNFFLKRQKHSELPVQKCCSLRFGCGAAIFFSQFWCNFSKFFAIGRNWIGPALIAIPPRCSFPQVKTVRSVEVGAMLTSSSPPKYNLSAVFCAAELLDMEEHAQVLRASPVPWVVVAKHPDFRVKHPHVPCLRVPLLRTRLMDTLTRLHAPPKTDAAVLAGPAGQPFAHLQVLSVDDVKSNQVLIEHFLQRAGAGPPDVMWDGRQVPSFALTTATEHPSFIRIELQEGGGGYSGWSRDS